ncbi:DUF4276 family protein [Nannocystaceae bacterium ST9]
MVKKIQRTLYVEGAAQNNKASRSEFRKALGKLFERAGIRMKPSVVPCGSRQRAFETFCSALAKADSDEVVLLLVDSEAPVTTEDPWEHVRRREGDGWVKPERATPDQLHLMVQMMEAWFLADPDALERHFGKGFRRDALPKHADIEKVAKLEVYRALEAATTPTKSGPYGKGSHSFKILAELDPKKLEAASPWAQRLFQALAAA